MSDDWKLSRGQEALWFVQRLNPSSTAYSVPLAAFAHGTVSARHLVQAFTEMAERHSLLRATVVSRADGPRLTVTPSIRGVTCTDASSWSDRQLEEAIGRSSLEPFDLEKGPLYRVDVFSRGEKPPAFLFNAHHLIMDLWSAMILLEDLGALCGQALGGPAAPMIDACSHPEYVSWHEDWLSSRAGDDSRHYWAERLARLPPALELPTDRPRVGSEKRGGRFFLRLDPEVAAGIAALARSERVTLFTVFLAALQILQYRYTGQEDMVTGAPAVGRRRSEHARAVGYFVNPIALRADLTGNPSVHELLQRLKAGVNDALLHQLYPFPLVAQSIRPGADPLFRTFLSVQRPQRRAPKGAAQFALGIPGAKVTVGPLSLEALPLPATTPPFDLQLYWIEENGIWGSCNYDAGLFDERTARRMTRHIETILGAMARNPNERIREISRSDVTDVRQVPPSLVGAAVAIPPSGAYALIEEQVRRNEETIAVQDEGQALTYLALDARATWLAGHLVQAGAGPSAPVAIHLERGVDQVVAVLAALKAGAAYVPLSPSAPPARNEYMLADSRARLLLTQRTLASSLASSARRLCIDELPCADATGCELPRVGPETVAYVLYTSGSTGTPKGVAVPHRALVNLLRAMQRKPGIEASDVVLAVTTLSFDIAALELLLPLTVGARVVIASQKDAADAEALARLLDEHSVTVMQATPSTWRLLVQSGWRRDGLKALCGGEALTPDLADALASRVGQLWNMYGPTETTIWSTCNRVATSTGNARVSIGGPIDNTTIYVRGASGELLPEGVAGELVIGGAGLAHGYHGRAALTAEYFVPDPFGGHPGARLYRTGDVGRWRSDGRIEFLGRVDHQVKIRGHRVELSEIEAVMRRQEGVRDALVSLSGPSDDARLCAWLTPETVDVSRLKRALSAVLPAYMVPSAYLALAAFPLTANGKIDRAALPSPAAIVSRGIEPRTPTETRLAGLWSDVLGRANVDVDEDFFAAGGHSLLAARLVGKINAAFSLSLPVRELFEAPTIDALAGRIDARTQVAESDAAVSLPDGWPESSGPREMSSSEQRLWFLCQVEPTSAAYHLAGGVHIDGPFDLHALEESLRAIQMRHQALRTRFVAPDGIPIAEVDPAAPFQLERAIPLGDTPLEREQEAMRLLEEAARKPMNLETGPLFRACVVSLAHDRHMLLVVLHHLIADGQSLEQIAYELGILYEARTRAPALPPIRYPYAAYVAWEKSLRHSESVETALDAHRARLHDAPQVLDLPCDAPRPPVHRSFGYTEPFDISAELTAKVSHVAREASATLFMTLAAAFGVFLSRLSGQDDLLLATPHSARSIPELEGMVGLLTTTLALRFDLAGDPSFAALVRATRTDTLAALASAQAPYDRLVELMVHTRDPSRPPLCQASIAAQGDPLARLTLAGANLRTLRVETASAKFDVSLYFAPAGDGLSCSLEYNASLFSAETARRWVHQFETLLRALVETPHLPTSRCTMMDATERRRILTDRNATAVHFPLENGLHHLVETQARRTPDAPALTADGTTLTYSELDQRANRLAWELVRRGVEPDARVGVCAERSVEMMVALLGILKAGAAYVPLDPTYPLERLRVICEEARLSQIVVAPHLTGTLPDGFPLVELNALAGVDPQDPIEAPEVRVSVDHAAYVLFTSGSTGRPKGVVISHGGIQNRLFWMQSAYRLESTEAVLQKTPFGFDVSVWEFFWPLMAGARLVMAKPEGHKDPRYLAETISEHGITTVHFVPSMFRAFLEEPLATTCRSLRRIICSGEALEPDLVQRGFSILPWVAIHNLYGPTEASVDVSSWTCRPSDTTASIPIGRPVANTQLWVLDRHMDPVPIGVVGELYIGGVQLARGYLDRPGLTAAAFVPDPTSTAGGERLYRTGDRARWRHDGELEFLGRIDQQVKLRGFRIETEEIEAQLQGHEWVKQAVVLLRGGERPQLVGYVVPRAGVSIELATLRRFLLERLPEYMVPAAFVALAELPLTANGKLHRAALPEPGEGITTESDLPTTSLEQEIAALWSAILGLPLERIGRHDDFFSLGGHSLLAARTLARMRQMFSVDLALSELFRHATVASVAELILERQLRDVDTELLKQLLDNQEGEPT
ncbi:amino acid adenylation domain-containing protein [Pendulispora rubella]|uniref:Amino acid adenylation domain-containing protein n=1 Tax=Pendulispora rubella TaxID=2741070 RepID=A0ABZ2LA99_9BACT